MISEDQRNDINYAIPLLEQVELEGTNEYYFEQNNRIDTGAPVVRTIQVFHEIINTGKIHCRIDFPE